MLNPSFFLGGVFSEIRCPPNTQGDFSSALWHTGVAHKTLGYEEKHYGDNVSYMEKLKVEGVTIIEQLLLSMNL